MADLKTPHFPPPRPNHHHPRTLPPLPPSRPLARSARARVLAAICSCARIGLQPGYFIPGGWTGTGNGVGVCVGKMQPWLGENCMCKKRRCGPHQGATFFTHAVFPSQSYTFLHIPTPLCKSPLYTRGLECSSICSYGLVYACSPSLIGGWRRAERLINERRRRPRS